MSLLKNFSEHYRLAQETIIAVAATIQFHRLVSSRILSA